jgi:hypothetical protein
MWALKSLSRLLRDWLQGLETTGPRSFIWHRILRGISISQFESAVGLGCVETRGDFSSRPGGAALQHSLVDVDRFSGFLACGRFWRTSAHRSTNLLMLTGIVTATACTSIGPSRIEIDAPAYAAAIRELDKSLVLENIIRMRYAEPPSFLELTQVVTGYTMRTVGAVGVDVLNISGLDPTQGTVNLDANVTFEDRPTLTYRPVRGRELLSRMLLPVEPARVLAVIQAGWPSDLVLGLLVQSINAVSNSVVTGTHRRPATPEFDAIVGLFDKLVATGALEIRVAAGADSQNWDDVHSLIWLESGNNLSAETRDDLARLRHLLGLVESISDYEIKFARTPDRPDIIAIRTRSLFQVMASIAATIDVPAEDVASGRTWPTFASAPQAAPRLTVHNGDSPPADAYAAVRRGSRWFWVDDTDLQSKRALGFVIILLSLTDFGKTPADPVLTISTGSQ